MRKFLAIAAAAVILGCFNGLNDVPAYHVFTAGIATTPADSLDCLIYTELPIPGELPFSWSGRSNVRILRWRLVNGARATPLADTTVILASLKLEQFGIDSTRFTILSPFYLEFSGQHTSTKVVQGTWQCDERVALSRIVTGRSVGRWEIQPVTLL